MANVLSALAIVFVMFIGVVTLIQLFSKDKKDD
jgi:hypothetical protein